MRGLIAALIAGLPISAAVADDPPPDEPYSQWLRAAGIEPDDAGILDYLRRLVRDEESRREARQLVAQLGNPSSRERDAATAQLLASMFPPVDDLEAAARSTDPEVRARARRVLARVQKTDRAPALLAVLRLVERRKIPGAAPLLLELVPEWHSPHIRRALRRALLAAVGPGDVAALRGAMESGDPKLRTAAITALAGAAGAECAEELHALCLLAEDETQLAAAEGLAYLCDRRCLPTLVSLLASDDLNVRIESNDLLQELTGQRFGFAAYASRKQRDATARAWQEWVDVHGATAELRLRRSDEPIVVGRTLLCVWADDTLREIDPVGELTLNIGGFDYLWGCQGLANGHRLAVDAERRTVIEYDLAGRVCWKREELPGRPTSVERLPNGNTLIAASDGDIVVELDQAGQIAWQLKIKGRPTTAQRLANGNTVINLQDIGRVVEVDRGGHVQWSLENLTRPHTAQMLENGNVLVCDMRLGKVEEFNRAGESVWSFDELTNPAQAQRLANGNTLIADERGLHEITYSGERVWHYPVSRARFHRY